MRRVPLTPLGWALIVLLVGAIAAAIAGFSALAYGTAVIMLVLVLGALSPVSARHLQTRLRNRPPDVPWIQADDRHKRRRPGAGA